MPANTAWLVLFPHSSGLWSPGHSSQRFLPFLPSEHFSSRFSMAASEPETAFVDQRYHGAIAHAGKNGQVRTRFLSSAIYGLRNGSPLTRNGAVKMFKRCFPTAPAPHEPIRLIATGRTRIAWLDRTPTGDLWIKEGSASRHFTVPGQIVGVSQGRSLIVIQYLAGDSQLALEVQPGGRNAVALGRVEGVAISGSGEPVPWRFAEARKFVTAPPARIRVTGGNPLVVQDQVELGIYAKAWSLGVLLTRGHLGNPAYLWSGGRTSEISDYVDGIVSTRWRAFWSRG